MRNVKRTLALLISLAPIFLPGGCSSEQASVETMAGSDPLEIPKNDLVARRFHESAPQTPTAVQSAIELSEKYARLSEETAGLRQENQAFLVRNRQLETRTGALDEQLQQAQRELAEANDLLIEMRIELNNWKTNILGFRDEMRDAETAQLETLMKILQVLGGQVDPGLLTGNDAGGVGSAAGSSSTSYR